MQEVRENIAHVIVKIDENPCAAGVFTIHASDDIDAIDGVATAKHRPKARRADSESRFLAMKKFSRPPPSRLIGARQNRFLLRIAAADSQDDFSSRRWIAAR
jgi:hypothetical protein